MKYLEEKLTGSRTLPTGLSAPLIRHKRSADLLLLIALIGLPCISRVAWGATLKAGMAKVDITPDSGVLLWGFSDRKSPATGSDSRLLASIWAGHSDLPRATGCERKLRRMFPS